jgi:hypothetical protein
LFDCVKLKVITHIQIVDLDFLNHYCAGQLSRTLLPPVVSNVGLARIEGGGNPVHNRVH